ncbi:MAG: carbohydrate porin [Pelatocladus maniniholoensis HA4357-MV3]|uniref:Carbohydrate porin n=1 Tax=Pelatocladus maniniholoensis HA4357-MV3 TaxID=1117104 RepID=A0A9E3LS50_9NOST|nr:carbohydrate porin [Pelatocladus maniniholoensis HA4357-MV3]
MLQFTDNTVITSCFFIITNPYNKDNNDKIFVGTVRTTFNVLKIFCF